MRRVSSGELQPAQALVLRTQALQLELQRAHQHLRRERRIQGIGARWGLDQDESEHQNDEWLITYLDMVTLLMVAMIMMLALAGPIGKMRDAARHAAVSSAVAPQGPVAHLARIPPPDILYPYPAAPAAAFMQLARAALPAVASPSAAAPGAASAQDRDSGPPLPTDPQSTMADQARVRSLLDQESSAIAAAAMPSRTSEIPGNRAPAHGEEASAEHPAARPAPPAREPATPSSSSEGAAVAASLALGDLGKDVEVIVNKQSVSFRVNSEILFATGQADLSPAGLAVLKRMAQVLVPAGYDITVEGYTDSVRVRSNAPYPSNWELSSARAGSVVRYLVANGIPKSHLKAVGFADSHPIADNDTPEGRARNRRVELVVSKHHTR